MTVSVICDTAGRGLRCRGHTYGIKTWSGRCMCAVARRPVWSGSGSRAVYVAGGPDPAPRGKSTAAAGPAASVGLPTARRAQPTATVAGALV